jgi:hypothetical protein
MDMNQAAEQDVATPEAPAKKPRGVAWTESEVRTVAEYARKHAVHKQYKTGTERLAAVQKATLREDRWHKPTDPNWQAWLNYEAAKPAGAPITTSYAHVNAERGGLRSGEPSTAKKVHAVAGKLKVVAATPQAPTTPPRAWKNAVERPDKPQDHPQPKPQAEPQLALPLEPRPQPAHDNIEPQRTLGEQLSELVGVFIGSALASALRYEPLHDALRGIAASVVGKQHILEDQLPLPAHSFASTPNPARKPRVLIAGLKGHQMTEMNNACKTMFELRFWHTDQSLDALRRTASECDIAVGFINFLSHAAEGVLQSRAQNYVRHAGGISTLKQRLSALAEVTTRAAKG